MVRYNGSKMPPLPTGRAVTVPPVTPHLNLPTPGQGSDLMTPAAAATSRTPRTPPFHVRARASASLQTGSTISISSHSSRSTLASRSVASRSNISLQNLPGSHQITRQDPMEMIESDSDEGSEILDDHQFYRDDADDSDGNGPSISTFSSTVNSQLDKEGNPLQYQQDLNGQDIDEALLDTEDADATQTCPVGQLLKNIHWKFEAIKKDTPLPTDGAPSVYDGPQGLKHGVAHSFNDPVECLAKCGGLDYELVAFLTTNSNDYAKKTILPKLGKNKYFHNVPWRNI